MTKQKKTVDAHAIEDNSSDRKYFVMAPRVVWAFSRNSYDYIFWCVVKDIAGESGECYIGIRDLAKLAKMSKTQAGRARDWLLRAGLLEGEVRKDPGYNAVWHLRVPDLWMWNVDWCKRHPTIAARLAFEISQSVPARDTTPEVSPTGTKCPLQGQSVPGVALKKNQKKNQKEHDYMVIWELALTELSYRTTPATYDAHVRPARAIDLVGDVLTIAAPAKSLPWLNDGALGKLVGAAVESIAGRPLSIKFVAAAEDNGET